MRHWYYKLWYFLFPSSCGFCKKRSLGVYAHGGMPVSFSICRDHAFLLGCSPETINRAYTWKKVGFNYTKKYHEEYSKKYGWDWEQRKKEFDDAATELNPQPTVHLKFIRHEDRVKQPSSYL